MKNVARRSPKMPASMHHHEEQEDGPCEADYGG
jgi:hypothetical protein